MRSRPSKCERAIVETGAVAEPRTVPVERDRGNEDRIEKSRGERDAPGRFVHAEGVRAAAFVERDEAHEARTQRDDAGDVDLAAALARERDERSRAELRGH